jgi:hypothetical protein
MLKITILESYLQTNKPGAYIDLASDPESTPSAKKTSNIHLPAPTLQDLLNLVSLNDEA